MIRRVSICLLLLFVAFGTVFGAGKLSVEKENTHVVSYWGLYVFGYAKVENVGDKPITVNAGVLEVFDENGDVITSSDYMEAFAYYLEPGEYTYTKLGAELYDYEQTVGDYNMVLTGKSSGSLDCPRLPCETSLELDGSNSWWPENYMYATVTNDTDTTQFGIEVVFALLDAEDNILYLGTDDLYSSRGLTAGSSIVLRCDIPSSFMDYFAENGITPAKVDAIAYVID